MSEYLKYHNELMNIFKQENIEISRQLENTVKEILFEVFQAGKIDGINYIRKALKEDDLK